MLAVLAVGGVLLVLVLFIQQRKKQSTLPPVNVQEPVQKVTAKFGSFMFENEPTAKRGEPYEFFVNGSSGEKQIVGFDIILKYDPNAFTFTAAKSMIADFQIFTSKRDTYVIVTGAKKPESTVPTILNDDDKLVSFTVTPKQTGEFSFEVVESTEIEKSQMVDEKTTVLYPSVATMSVEVK